MVTATYTDSELLAIIQAHDIPGKELLAGTTISAQKATELLIERHQPRLVKRAINFWHGDDDAALDTLQETLIKAIEKIHTVKGEFGPWINTVLRNTFLDEWRKNHNLNEKFTFLSLDTLDAGKEKGDDQGPNKAERLVNKHSASPSAEDDHMDESAQERVVNLIRSSLSQGETDFFIAYQEDPNPKTSKDKVKYHRLKKKLIRDLLRRWVQSGESLEDIMTARQAKVLSAKYSLDRREADIFKEQGLSDKAELDQLLADGTLRLFNALCAERASN